MFNINWSNLISNLLPWFHVRTVMLSWLGALVHPMQALYTGFLQFREARLYETKYNGQVAELEYVLNDYYYNDGTLRTIYIEDNTDQGDTFIYNTLENEDETHIFNADEAEGDEYDTFIYNVNEGSGSSDFIVWVPDTLTFDINEITSLVRKYKMAGPSFSIETYTP